MVTRTSSTLQIRWRIAADDREVLRIDERCYLDSLSYTDLRDMLRERSVICVVAEDRGHVLGYCIYRLCGYQIKILRLGVDPRERRCGVGTALIDRLKDKLGPQRRDTLTTDLPGASVAAQLFLSRCGFVGEPRPNDVIRFDFHLEVE